jgi:excinuclease ABC subunit A
LAGEATRKIQRSWYLVDEPSSGDHPEDVAQMASALRGLVERGATVVVADTHPVIMAAADWTVDLSLA